MTNIAVVTGGTGGIGREICLRLVADGFQVLAGDIGVAPADNGAPATDICEGVFLHHLDVTSEESAKACIDHAAGMGTLKAVVNCAGILSHGLIEDINEADYQLVWNVNVIGAMHVCKAASPHLGDGGAIVNISSVTSAVGRMPGASAYGASKAGLNAFTRYLANELAPRGIRVNCLAPGYIKVLPMSPSMQFIATADNEDDAVAWCEAQAPMGRMADPAEMAGPVSFLISDDASFITGQTLFADGGVTAS